MIQANFFVNAKSSGKAIVGIYIHIHIHFAYIHSPGPLPKSLCYDHNKTESQYQNVIVFLLCQSCLISGLLTLTLTHGLRHRSTLVNVFDATIFERSLCLTQGVSSLTLFWLFWLLFLRFSNVIVLLLLVSMGSFKGQYTLIKGDHSSKLPGDFLYHG